VGYSPLHVAAPHRLACHLGRKNLPSGARTAAKTGCDGFDVTSQCGGSAGASKIGSLGMAFICTQFGCNDLNRIDLFGTTIAVCNRTQDG